MDMAVEQKGQVWQEKAPLAVLTILAVFIFLFNLGGEALMDYDEAAYGEVIRQTMESGDMLTPKSGNSPFFDKPPLYVWFGIASVKAFGLTEFALRLPSALAGIASVLVLYAIAREMGASRFWSAAAGYMLLATGAFLDAGRQVRLDTLVVFFILLGFLCFLRGLKNPKWLWGFGAAVGFAVMAKSVIGIFAYLFILIAAIFMRRFDWLRSRHFWIGQGIAALIAVPWHAYQTIYYGRDFWSWYFGTHVLGRYGENLLGNDVSIGMYFEYLYYFATPWIHLFVGIAIVFILVSKMLREGTSAPVYIPLAAAVAVFVVFASAETKIPYYLVPMYPFVTLFIALFMSKTWNIPIASRYKTVAGLALGLLALTGLVNSLDKGYHLDPAWNIEHRLAEDERVIGGILRLADASVPVYFYDDMYWETVRFYSRGRDVARVPDDALTKGDFYLVAFTWKLRWLEEMKKYADAGEPVFAGEHFTLLRIVPAR